MSATTTRQQQQHVVAACYLGWTLDAFDFFIMVFVFADVAREFGTTITVVTWAITLTLLMRALGAFLFGRFADRFGRRPALMASILGYSVLEFASGFAPSLTVFLILRALFGIAMGGEWGIGASLTMESIPARWRGPVSGMLQAGYPTGYLLASVLNGLAHESLGWRGMFMVGALPALLVLYIRSSVPESPDFVRMAQRPRPGVVETVRANLGLTIYAVIMMMAFNFFSHGTQDLYPTYLTVQRHLPRPTLTTIVVIYNIGAMIGGVGFGYLSQRIGRRVAIVIAALLAIPVIWPWAFGGDALTLGIGAFLMQICVQGAWGVIPAHLNELSPPAVRATFPGVTYQVGNFLAAANATIQSSIADSMGHDFRYALAGTAGVVAVVIALLVGFGQEARDRQMGDEAEPAGVH
ncbi:MAG: MFS transporter [Acidisphaera sp.]|nr:MFS transporter [Acidisphaera sp.]